MNIVISSIISLVIAIVFAYFCHKIAVGRVLWAILGFLFTIIAIIVVAVLPAKGGRPTTQ